MQLIARKSKQCKKSDQSIDLEDWLILSGSKSIIERISSDHYSKAYPILISFFDNIASNLSWDNLIVGLHTIYGWMPTIPKLKRIMSWDNAKKTRFLETLADVLKSKNPTEQNWKILVEFTNNSAVGASKLLHFLSPEDFPIWDSRTAKAFFNKSNISYYQINNTRNLQSYSIKLREWKNSPLVTTRCSEIRRQADFLSKVSSLRIVELVLFHKTKSKR
jgi:hypothetical protein